MKTKGSYKCSACPGGTEVIDSRYVKGSDIYRRRRRCTRCGERFTTYEVREGDLARMTSAEHRLASVREALA